MFLANAIPSENIYYTKIDSYSLNGQESTSAILSFSDTCSIFEVNCKIYFFLLLMEYLGSIILHNIVSIGILLFFL